ncbi:hypothetical protein I4U23_016339 [Adineta vaga]|nr:hypothetical protein I4U23_016339 [Adineta vaga]
MGNGVTRKKEKIVIEKSIRNFNQHSIHTQYTPTNSLNANPVSVGVEKLIDIIWFDSRSVPQDDIIDTQTTKQILSTALQNSELICFSDINSCFEFLQQHRNSIEILFLVISGHDFMNLFNALDVDLLRRIDSIFIFCLVEKLHENKQEYHEKVVGTFSEHMKLLQSIQEQAIMISQQDLIMKYYNCTQKTARMVPSYATGEFVWTRVIKEAALQIQKHVRIVKQMFDRFRILYRDNTKELDKIDQFEKDFQRFDFHPKEIIQWYTKDSFLYRIINQSLRTQNTSELIIFSPYIANLCRAIRSLQTKVYSIMTFFRGCTLSRTALDEFNANIGSLLSINSFFSATRQRDFAKGFASCHALNGINTLVSIIFEIEVKNNKLSFFADISMLSSINDEEEVLFDLNAIFTINNVTYCDDDECWIIHLIADEDTYVKHECLYRELCEIYDLNASPFMTIGFSLIMMGNTREAYRHAISLPLSYNSMSGSSSLFILTCFIECDYSKALKLLKRIYEFCETSNSYEVHHCWTYAACWIAHILVSLGEFKLASQYIHSIIKYYRTIKQSIYSYEIPMSLEYLEDLGKALEMNNEIETSNMILVHFNIEKMPLVSRAMLLPGIHTRLARSYLKENRIKEAFDHLQKAEIEGELLLSHHALLRIDIYLIYACIFLYKNEFDQCSLYLNQAETIARMNLSQSCPSILGCVYLLNELIMILQENPDSKNFLSLARTAFLRTANYIDVPKVIFTLENICKIHREYRKNLNSCITTTKLVQFVKDAFEICRIEQILEGKSSENVYRPLLNYIQHIDTLPIEDLQIEKQKQFMYPLRRKHM